MAKNDICGIVKFHEWTPESLKKTRIELGLTQEEAGSPIGVTGMTIRHVESGESKNPSTILLYGIVLERYAAWKKMMIPLYGKTDGIRLSEVRTLDEMYQEIIGGINT